MSQKSIKIIAGVLFSAAAMLAAMPASATSIVVTQYGNAPNGYPYAIAMAKGFFKEEGADVTAIVSSKGGGTTIRNMITTDVPYGEVGAGNALSANQQGANLIIISDNVPSVGDINWVALKNSPLNGPADLKGKKIGFTNPRSVTEALAYEMLKAIKLPKEDVQLVSTGGFGEGLAALEAGFVDVAPLVEPLSSRFPDKYKVIVPGTVLPSLDNTVGVTTKEMAEKNKEFIKGVLRGRRKAVAYMYAHPDESSDIVAKAYNIDPKIARTSINNLINIKIDGTPYFGDGQIHLDGIKRMIDIQKMVGSINGNVDIEGVIDTSYLPDDLQKIK